ncbi:MAG: gamma-glutamyltransferase family protein [Acidobacteria bacterium]|nr:gamma-glutamyltransferase family protein [Acidobacteriota bacterium]
MRHIGVVCVGLLAVAVNLHAQPLRPEFTGTHGVVAAGRTLTVEAGTEMLVRGGNAIDAGVAAILAAAVVEISHFGLGGEAPMVIYLAKSREVVVINGQGTAPAAASPSTFVGDAQIPGNGPLAATVPAVVDATTLALARYGTLPLADVLAPAIRLADGFPMYQFLSRYLTSERRFSEPYADTMRTYYPDGRVTRAGEVFRQPALARTLRMLADADTTARQAGASREDAIAAARDTFYTGPFAARLATAVRNAGGLLTEEDLARYRSKVEQPVSVTYRGYTVHKAGPWNQGPVLLQTLNLLEGFDLRAMGHLSADAIHTVAEAMKLAYADRDRYYGDPDFVSVPITGLLSKAYANDRRALIDATQASLEQRPGNPLTFEPKPTAVSGLDAASAGRRLAPIDPLVDPHVRRVGRVGESGDTTAIEVADRDGNLFSATPSSGWLLGGAFVAGDTGVPMSNRMQAFRLEPGSPNLLAGGKRPRTTLTPTIVTRDGAPFLAIGTPGGDSQDQQILQVLLNVIDHDMSLQAAVESARFNTLGIQSSFENHRIEPGVLEIERSVPEAIRRELERRGHRLRLYNPQTYSTGIVAAGVDPATGRLRGAADVRRERSVTAW